MTAALPCLVALSQRCAYTTSSWHLGHTWNQSGTPADARYCLLRGCLRGIFWWKKQRSLWLAGGWDPGRVVNNGVICLKNGGSFTRTALPRRARQMAPRIRVCVTAGIQRWQTYLINWSTAARLARWHRESRPPKAPGSWMGRL